ncbi:MAG: threonine/homoserine/homoserine lactone efflux protein [Candidatus Endobugula sp.]|jgi:threonine/homoserine/homoserine lactone efflux protein
MLDIQTWIIFVSSALALAFAPGPGMLYVLSRTMSGGRSAGIASTVGSAGGGMIHVFAAALGVSALLATSAIAFSIVKYLGAAFLIFLGIKMIIAALTTTKQNITPEKIKKETKANFNSLLYQGIISEILNPKTAIFFLAFIPQFVQLEVGNVFGQFLLLGTIVVIFNTLPDFIICFFSKPIEKLWQTSSTFRKTQQATSGIALIGLGAYLAMSSSNHPPLQST